MRRQGLVSMSGLCRRKHSERRERRATTAKKQSDKKWDFGSIADAIFSFFFYITLVLILFATHVTLVFRVQTFAKTCPACLWDSIIVDSKDIIRREPGSPGREAYYCQKREREGEGYRLEFSSSKNFYEQNYVNWRGETLVRPSHNEVKMNAIFLWSLTYSILISSLCAIISKTRRG